MKALIIAVVTLCVCVTISSAQISKESTESAQLYISIETDPAFWIGTLPNGLGFDANVDFRLNTLPNLRFGILGYSGLWSGEFGKSLLLTDDFIENNWQTEWNGFGIEVQYQFRLGMQRGGLQPGVRLQWNQFIYSQNAIKKGEANHFVITPQVGFQWFPLEGLGLYLLPWGGLQVPLAGTDKLGINAQSRETRKLLPVVTAHIGWEFTVP